MTDTKISKERAEDVANIVAHGIDLGSTPAAIAERILASLPKVEAEAIAASLMRITAIVEGLYGFLDLGPNSPEELKENWTAWCKEKVQAWEAANATLSPSTSEGEVLTHAQRAYDILVSGEPPFSARECRASYALTYIQSLNPSPAAPSLRLS